MKITNKYDLVKDLLEQKTQYRDCYYKLLTRVWWDEIKRSKTMTAKEFLTQLRDKQLSHPESIMRVRRKVEKEHEHLRGVTYAARKVNEQNKVKKELGYQ